MEEDLYERAYRIMEAEAERQGCNVDSDPVVDWICENSEKLANKLRWAVEAHMADMDDPPGGDETDCPICGASYTPGENYPWHKPDEDCRAVRSPE